MHGSLPAIARLCYPQLCLYGPSLPACLPPQALSRKLEVAGLPTVLLFCGSEGRVEQMQVRRHAGMR